MDRLIIAGSVVVNLIEDGYSAPYYFAELFAWSNVESTNSTTTSPFGNNTEPNSAWKEYIPENTENLAYLWCKVIRHEWVESTRSYTNETPQYYRKTGTNGTSIKINGTVDYFTNEYPPSADIVGALAITSLTDKKIYVCQQVYTSTYAWVESGISASDGDAYTVAKDNYTGTSYKGHLVMWSDEASSWIDLGIFQGQAGKTYYTHIAWATNVNTSTNPITVTGFVTTKSASDTTHLWMGVYVDENAGQDSSNASKYTWSYNKGPKGDTGEDAYSFDVAPNVMSWPTDEEGNLKSYTAIGGVARAYKGAVLQGVTDIISASGLPFGFTLDKSNNNGFSVTPHEYYTTFVSNGVTVYVMKRKNQYAQNDLVYNSSMMRIGTVSSVSSGGITVSLDAGGTASYNQTGNEYHVELSEPAIASLTLQTGTVSRAVSLILVPSMAGSGAIHFDLNNESDAIQYAGDTNLTGSVTSQATMYNSATPLTVSCEKDASSTIGDNFCSVTSGGLITVSDVKNGNGDAMMRGVVVVKAVYNGTTFYVAFTVQRLDNGAPKYQLKIDKSAVVGNISNNSASATINVKVYKTVVNADSKSLVTTLVTSLDSEDIRLFRKLSNVQNPSRVYDYTSNGFNHTINLKTTAATGVTYYVTNDYDWGAGGLHIYDYEEITITKVQNGPQGEKGDATRQPYEWGTWENFASSAENFFEANKYESPFFVRTEEYKDLNGIVRMGERKWRWVGDDGTFYAPTSSPVQGRLYATVPSSSDPNWELMITDFKFLISEAQMADYGKFGAGIFNKDYAFSQYGTIDDSSLDHYKNFRPEFFKGEPYTMFEGSKNIQGSTYYDTDHMFSFGEIFLEETINYTFAFTIVNATTNLAIRLYDMTNGEILAGWSMSGSDSHETHPANHDNILQGRVGRSYLLCVYAESSNGSVAVSKVTVSASKAFKPNIYIDWLKGEIYSQLGRFVNVIVEGALNNLLTEIGFLSGKNVYNASTNPKGIAISSTRDAISHNIVNTWSDVNVYTIDLLRCGDVIKFIDAPSGVAPVIYLPMRIITGTTLRYIRPNTMYGGAELTPMSFDDYRRLSGRTITFINQTNGLVNIEFGRAVEQWNGRTDIVTDAGEPPTGKPHSCALPANRMITAVFNVGISYNSYDNAFYEVMYWSFVEANYSAELSSGWDEN